MYDRNRNVCRLHDIGYELSVHMHYGTCVKNVMSEGLFLYTAIHSKSILNQTHLSEILLI